MSSKVSPIKLKLCYHLGEVLALICKARRRPLRLFLLKAYAEALVKIINLGTR